MGRPTIARATLAIVVTTCVCCSSLASPSEDDHVVRAPISQRANAVLASVVAECGSSSGRWRWSLSPGCSSIWATQFGYRAGLRRHRDDLIEIGRVTAKQVSADILALAWSAIFGTVDPDEPALAAFPALFVSGTLGGNSRDAWLLRQGLGSLDDVIAAGRLQPMERAGVAVLVAEVSRLDAMERLPHLSRARRLAEGVGDDGGGTWRVLAWSAIARASREAADLDRAQDAVAATAYRFEPGRVSVAPGDEILSRHLAMIHGLADLAQATGDAEPRARAFALLEYVFSDAYFDGRFLAHDRLAGERSQGVCSGCNLMALFLADRLYGDSLALASVPELLDRDAKWLEEAAPKRRNVARPSPQRAPEQRIALAAGADGRPGSRVETVLQLPAAGRVVFVHEATDARSWLEYDVLAATDQYPRGAMLLRFATHRFTDRVWTTTVGFDDDGTALLTPHGFEPLLFSASFRRHADGAVTGAFWTGESQKEQRQAPLGGAADRQR
jgi:hypothetical protein